MSGEVKLFDSSSPDPLTRERGLCIENCCKTRPFVVALQDCTKRVTKKAAYTAETCHDEILELMEALDKCTKNKAFLELQ
ncbi:unnamed protein product [Spodoptera littoralis]|uniref:Ubiquinol-cytochrome C reductase hinge domain-containing protein n=1 Tax=Spodoptera littoralis TaxID=7109 RepID=A0A9P0I5I2_SPOLI|nr:unnamed protein product [Spodoptera littoralis]CAH1641449.1 unnamed protein product [Spodoptera littoralis]